MVTINIGRKEAIFFSVVILVFVVAGVSMAYNSGQPAVHGHDANEIANLPTGGGGAIVNIGNCVWVNQTGWALPGDGFPGPASCDGANNYVAVASFTDNSAVSHLKCCKLAGGASAGGGLAFGNWSVIGTNIAGGVNYGPAATDGIVTATAWDGHLQGFTDSTATPTRMVIRHNLYHSGSGSGITMPVKKGDYWRVETQGGDGLIDSLYWLPITPVAASTTGSSIVLSNCAWTDAVCTATSTGDIVSKCPAGKIAAGVEITSSGCSAGEVGDDELKAYCCSISLA